MSSSRCGSCAFACAVLRILLSRCCRRMCGSRQPGRPEYSLLCLGLTGAGKSAILATLANEDAPKESTTGFAVKAIGLPNAIFNIQELGGGPNIRPYWSHYFQNKHAIVFVIDSSSDVETMALIQTELESVLKNSSLQGLPLLVILNKADVADAQTADEILGSLAVEDLCENRRWMSAYCSSTDQDKLREIFGEFSKLISLSRQQQEESFS